MAALQAANPSALGSAPLAAGSYTVMATYAGNANYTSASGVVDFTIGQATPAVSVTDAGGTYSTSAFPATDATVTGVGTDGTIASFGDPSLLYTYYAGSYATVAALDAANLSALDSAPVVAGSYTVMATYAGNANYTAASGLADFTIGQATPTVSVSDAGGTYNTSAFPATDATVTGVGTDGTIASFGDPGLSYTYYAGTYATLAAFEAANPTALASAPVAGGSFTIMATYVGNANYTPASGLADFTIGQATPTVSVTDVGGTYNTSAFPATDATVTGVGTDGTIAAFGDPSLSYTYYAGSYATVAALEAADPSALGSAPVAAGSYTVMATYAGNANYTSASSVADFTIGQATPTVSVTDASGTYSTSAFPATDATVTGVGTDGTIASFGDPSLSYTYYAGSYATVADLEAANPSALGSAPVAAGSYTVLAAYAGNANYTPASGVADFTIGQATPTVSVSDAGGTYNTSTFPATSATVTGVGTDGTIAAFGNPSLSYTYYAGSYATVAALEAASPSALGSAPVAAGSYTVMATYAGNTNYASASGVADFTIGQATPTVSVSDPGGTYNTSAFPATSATVTGVGSDGTIAAFGDPSLSYTYYAGSYATLAAFDAANPSALASAPLAAGSYAVLATYAGNANYAPASGLADFTIGQATPTVSVTDAGGTYNTLTFPTTDATVSGEGTDGTIASFGDPSLSYTYYAGTYATLAAFEAANPTALAAPPR